MLHVSRPARDWSQVSLSFPLHQLITTTSNRHTVLTLYNLLLARACALHDSSHYRRAPSWILCCRAGRRPSRNKARACVIRVRRRVLPAHACTAATARPIIAQRTTCAAGWQIENLSSTELGAVQVVIRVSAGKLSRIISATRLLESRRSFRCPQNIASSAGFRLGKFIHFWRKAKALVKSLHRVSQSSDQNRTLGRHKMPLKYLLAR